MVRFFSLLLLFFSFRFRSFFGAHSFYTLTHNFCYFEFSKWALSRTANKWKIISRRASILVLFVITLVKLRVYTLNLSMTIRWQSLAKSIWNVSVMNQLIFLHTSNVGWPFSQNICNQIFSFAFCSTQKVWHFCLKRTNKKWNITNISFDSNAWLQKGLRFVFYAKGRSLLLSFRIATRRKGKEAGVSVCICIIKKWNTQF